MAVVVKTMDNFVKKYSIRRIMLIIMIGLTVIGFTCSAIGTFSTEYTIERVKFSNETFYHKSEAARDTFQPLGVTLVSDNNEIFDVAAYIYTPTGYPDGTKFPTIIWCHGMVATAEMQMHYAMEYASAGFKVIATHLTGHGSSGGEWDLGLMDIQIFYSAIEYAMTLDDVNPDLIGVSGHSNGAFAAIRSAIFDNSPLGTGGNIKSVATIWALSDFTSTITELTGGVDPTGNPDFSWLVPMFMGINSPYISEDDALSRSLVDYINGTNLPNWCLISGTADQMSSDTIMYDVMDVAVDNQATASELRTICESTYDEKGWGQWNNTEDSGISFEDGTARKILIKEDADHIEEAFSPLMIQSLIDWFVLSMDLDPADHQSRMERGTPIFLLWFLRIGGAAIMIGAFLMSQLVVAAYFAPILFPERRLKYVKIKNEKEISDKPEMKYGGFLPPGLHEYLIDIDNEKESQLQMFTRFSNTWKQKWKYFTGLTLMLTGGVALFFAFTPPPFMRIWIFNGYVWQFLIAAILLWIYALLTLRHYKKSRYYGPFVSLDRVGGSTSGLFLGFIFVSVVMIPALIVFNTLSFITYLPTFFPKPYDPTLWWEAILFGLIVWALYLPLEVMVKTQLFAIKRKFSTKWGYWSEILTNATLTYFMWLFAYLIGMLFMGPTLLKMLFSGSTGALLFIIINLIMFIGNGILGFVTAFFYQRTRNLFACSLYPAFMWVVIIYGKYFAMYTAI